MAAASKVIATSLTIPEDLRRTAHSVDLTYVNHGNAMHSIRVFPIGSR